MLQEKKLSTAVILVVDDEEFNRHVISQQISTSGDYEVAFATNGSEALEVLNVKDVDLMFLDIHMPVIDGYGVLEHMKANMRLRHIPVVMTTSADDLESVVRCIEMGADDFLPKPVKPTLLKARLEASLEKKRLYDQQTAYLNQTREAKKRSEELLNVILPAAAVSELKATGKVTPRGYDEVAVLFCDITNFTAYCTTHSAEEVVAKLQVLFEKFEGLMHTHHMEKIKTIGDEFMATAGLMLPNQEPLFSAVKCGLNMVEAAKELNNEWNVRVGVHVGPLYAGVVGHQKYQFDVWGDTVNTAARMASVGSEGVVAMTHDSWLQIEHQCLGRLLGFKDVKGKGKIEIIECTGLQ